MPRRTQLLFLLALAAPALSPPALGAASSPVPQTRNFGLSEAQRRAVWTQAMRGQLAIAEQTQDAGLTKLLALETKGGERTAKSASLSCALMTRLDTQAAKQQPLIDALHERIRRSSGLSAQALDAILLEGEAKGWPLP